MFFILIINLFFIIKRCTEFSDITLGFNGLSGKRLLIQDKRLREMHFGKDEGLNYDTLSNEKKMEIDSWNYAPEKGETWSIVNERFNEFLIEKIKFCLLYTSPSPRDGLLSRMPSSA